MHSRSTLSGSQREQRVELFEAGFACRAAAKRLGVSRDAVRRGERRWKLHGRRCLMGKSSKQQYCFELKKAVVERFVADESKMELSAAFGLTSEGHPSTWMRQRRAGGDEALRPKPKGRPKGSPPPARVTVEDKLRRENKRLQAENA